VPEARAGLSGVSSAPGPDAAATGFDVFVSYAHADAGEVAPLVQALRGQGLSVWQDEDELADFESIDRSIREGLANSKALVAYYSATYPSRRACQWELTAAFLAGQRSGDPRERVLVVNPEPRADHIYPVELQDSRHVGAEGDEGWAARLAESVERRVERLDSSLGEAGSLDATPRWVGGRGVGSTGFVGRFAEMWRIHSALQSSTLGVIGGISASAAQIRGLGGAGKSLLAEEYALRFGAAYPGGVFWLRAYGGDGSADGISGDALRAELDRQTRALASGLGLAVDGLNPEQAEAALADEIERRALPCLWVVDDIPAGLDAAGLRDWFAPHPLAKTLLTTRSREYGRLAEAVDVGGLPAAEALELLSGARRPQDEAEWAAARELVDDLGHHPLALEVAGAALASLAGLQSFEEFRDALRHADEDELELAGELADALPNGHETSIAATLRRSLQQLGEESRDFLRLAAVLAPAPIPARLVEAAFAHADGGDRAGARRRVIRGLREADRLSLADAPKEGLWRVHALVGRTMRFTDASPERSRALRAGAVDALNDDLAQLEDARVRATVEPFVPHARELARDPQSPAEARLLGWVALYDLICGNHDSGVSLRRRQCEATRRLLGDDHPETLDSVDRLGRALWVCGDYGGARELAERAVEGRRRALGEEHPDTLQSMEFLAIVMADLGDTAGGRRLLEQLIEPSERVLGPDDRSTLRTVQGLAWSMYLDGEFERARAVGEELVERQRRALGPDHVETLQSEGNLALCVWALGDLAGARRIEERLLDVRRRVLGEDSTHTLWSANNLACIVAEEGDVERARGELEPTVEVMRRTQGAESPETLTAQTNLALALCLQGELDPADALASEALEVRRRTVGEEHRETLDSLDALAAVRWYAGAVEEARRLHERTVELSHLVLGEGHPHTAVAAANLALVICVAESGAQATSLAREAARELERRLGPEHRHTVRVRLIADHAEAERGDPPREHRIVHWRGV
jgi:tetratricopeptide (TPR) repeat protein